MIAAWMFTALVFSALMAAAAWCGEAALRVLRRPTRAPWLMALVAAVLWPVLAPMIRHLVPIAGEAGATGTSLTITAISQPLSASPFLGSWVQRLDTPLLVLWIAASLVVLNRLGRGLLALSRIRRASQPSVIDGVPVLLSDSIGPAVVGILQTRVVVPESILSLEEPLRRLVLRHENEHRKAHDPLILLGSALAIALVPWNLPLWWITHRARLALELDCDARVLAADPDASLYGKLLLLISQQRTLAAFAPMLAAHTSHLEQRINAMLSAPAGRTRTRFTLAIAGALVAVMAACSARIADVTLPHPTQADTRTLVDANQPLYEYQVEQLARQIPGTGNIRYPDQLRAANVEGEVLAQFIVGVDGKAEPGTFKVLKSDHDLFTRSVAAALTAMQFQPAEVGGKKVRQYVQQPFTFSLSKSSTGSSTSGVLRAPGQVVTAPAQRTTVQHAPVQRDSAVAVVRGTAVPAAPRVPADTMPYFEFQVRKGAKQIPGTGNVRYPDLLRSASVEGDVLAQFVVNSDGTVDVSSFKVLKSSHELFTESVRNALPNMRFEPATTGGNPVRQLMQMPFTFNLSKQL